MTRSEAGQTPRWLLFVAPVVALLFVMPLIWVVSASLRQPGLPPSRSIEWIPDPVTWSNYAVLFDLLPFLTYVKNSLIVTWIALVITLLTASWAGFGMVCASPRVSRFFLGFAIALLLVPNSSFWLTRFFVFKFLGIIDTHWALIAPAIMGTSPVFALLFFWSFRRIPSELIEAAQMDGARTMRVWWSILLPMSRPVTVTVAILTFLTYWSDFTSPLLYLKSEELYTLTIGIQQLHQLDRTNWPILMAGCVVLIVPAIIMFAIVQRGFLGDHRSGSALS